MERAFQEIFPLLTAPRSEPHASFKPLRHSAAAATKMVPSSGPGKRLSLQTSDQLHLRFSCVRVDTHSEQKLNGYKKISQPPGQEKLPNKLHP